MIPPNTIVKRVFVSIFSLLLFIPMVTAQELELIKLWESEKTLKVPESVRYCPGMDVLFVSNVNGKPTEANGKGFISILNTDASIKNLHWVDGLNAPKGMAIMNKKLYVADLTELVVIDIQTATIEKRIKVDGATFLNDVAADTENETIFVSDSRAGYLMVYAYNGEKISLFYQNEDIPLVNGLYSKNDQLFMGAKDLFVLNKKSKEITKLVAKTQAIDGLEAVSDNWFIATNWSGRIFAMNKEGKQVEFKNTIPNGYNTADIGIDKKKNMIFVPTFNRNSVLAFKYIFK